MSKPNSQTCSDTVHLERFLNEQLDETEEAEVQQHISSCPDCQRTLERAAADKSIWDGLRDHLTWVPEGDTDEGKSDRRLKRLVEYLAPTDDPKMLGRLGTYEVCGIIGQGSTGIVLKALEPALNRFVAIKVMSPLFSSSGAARKRFARESRAVAAVSHEHVVPIYAVSEWRELPYIVMQYIPGVSLLQRIDKDGPLDTCDVARIGLQIAKGLAAAHDQGVVHRDVKPANVLLENNVDRAMVTDFGLARVADEASMTRSGTIAGTPQYMSPEQAQGETVDPRSDLFSLGSLMYAACTARPPFRAETVFGVISRVCNSEPRPIREINPKIDEWLVAVIDRLMTKDRENRFQSASEVTSVLSAELAHAQNPTGVPKPSRGWAVQTPTSGSGTRKWIAGLTVAALGIAAAFAFLPPIKGGNSNLAGLFSPVEQSNDGEGSGEQSGKPAPPEENNPVERAVVMPILGGLETGKISWTQNEDEWNKNATRAFDQKIGDELYAGTHKSGKVVVNADIADVVVRHTEGDTVELTILRRVLADSRAQAEKFVNQYHTLYVEQDEQKLQIDEKFQRRQPEPGSADKEVAIKNGKVISNNGILTKKGIAAQNRVSKVLITIGLPRDSDIEVVSARGGIAIGDLQTNVKAKTFKGEIKVGHTRGNLDLITTNGKIDASQGCDGDVSIRMNNGRANIADVKGKLDGEVLNGTLTLTRISGAVDVKTTGGKAVVRDCKDAVNLMTTRGNLVVGGGQKSGFIRASGGNILLDQTTGDVYAQTSGGNVIVNEILGKTSAHAEHGNVMVNASKSPTSNSVFSANAGNVRFNLSEAIAVNVEAKGNVEANNLQVQSEGEGLEAKSIAKLNDGGKLVAVSSSTGTISLNVLKPAELKKSLGGSGGLGGSGLGGSGSTGRMKAATAAAIAKMTGEPRPGGLVTVKLDDAEDSNIDGYTLYLPESHDKSESKFAVLVYLQGGYGVGGEISNINNWGLPRLIRDESDLSNERNKLLLDSFIVVSPHIIGGEYHEHPEVVKQILDTVMTKYKADPNRVYLTGLSRGGHGTWGLASRMPNTFAAISPIASDPDHIADHAALANSAIWIAQNTGDRFPHSDVLQASKEIEEAGKLKFYHIDRPTAAGTEYLKHRYVFSSPVAKGHDAWTDMYESVEFYKWLLKQRRDISADVVRN